MRIIIYARNITSLDGVGNSVKYFQNALKKNYEVLLVSYHSDIPDVINFKNYLDIHVDSNILIYHFSIYDLLQKKLLDLDFKYKIIYYHGITEPKFFKKDSQTSLECINGLKQIKNLDSFDLYLANSTYSKNQFSNILKNKVILNKFSIMPPLNLIDEAMICDKKNSLDFNNIKFYYLGTLGDHKNVFKLCDLFCSRKKSLLSILTSTTKEDTCNIIDRNLYNKYVENNINFYHRLDDKKKNKLINKQDSFISFSSHEGFCIPLFEAILLSKPVLVNQLECFKDYLPDYYNFLDEQITYESLLESLMENYKNIEYTREYTIVKYQKYLKSSWDIIYALLKN